MFQNIINSNRRGYLSNFKTPPLKVKSDRQKLSVVSNYANNFNGFTYSLLSSHPYSKTLLSLKNSNIGKKNVKNTEKKTFLIINFFMFLLSSRMPFMLDRIYNNSVNSLPPKRRGFFFRNIKFTVHEYSHFFFNVLNSKYLIPVFEHFLLSFFGKIKRRFVSRLPFTSKSFFRKKTSYFIGKKHNFSEQEFLRKINGRRNKRIRKVSVIYKNIYNLSIRGHFHKSLTSTKRFRKKKTKLGKIFSAFIIRRYSFFHLTRLRKTSRFKMFYFTPKRSNSFFNSISDSTFLKSRKSPSKHKKKHYLFLRSSFLFFNIIASKKLSRFVVYISKNKAFRLRKIRSRFIIFFSKKKNKPKSYSLTNINPINSFLLLRKLLFFNRSYALRNFFFTFTLLRRFFRFQNIFFDRVFWSTQSSSQAFDDLFIRVSKNFVTQY